MCALKKIAFGESLLNSMQEKKKVVTKVSDVNQIVTTPSQQPIVERNDKLKTAVYVSSALALTSLGVAGILLGRNSKSVKSFQKSIASLNEQLKKSTAKIELFSQESSKAVDASDLALERVDKVAEIVGGSNRHYEQLNQNVNRLIKETVETVNAKFDSINSRIDNLNIPSMKVTVFPRRTVNVDGLEMKLGTNISEINGSIEEEMRSLLRTESTKRILGLSQHQGKLPEYSIIRIPTSELIPNTQAGGLAVVPRDIAANLSAMMNGHQKGAVILDTPLYVGQTAQNQFLYKSALISEKTNKFEGQYEYLKKIITPKGPEIKKLATLNKVQELSVPLYTDTGIKTQNVGVYISDLMEAPVDWKNLKNTLEPELRKEISNVLKESGQYETDLVKIVQNPHTREIESYGKYRTVFYDAPQFDMSARLLNPGEKFDIYRNDTLATGETERMAYFSKFFTEQLYNSEESNFVLQTIDKVDEAGNIAKKEFVKLGADAIIGNDWHTGFISAILRQLTTVKKYYGMDPQIADKLQNLPIMTILHNVEYQGAVNHSQEKLFNIAFGEHAAKIVENAFMPDIAVKSNSQGLPKHLWNSMMVGQSVNPVMMAASYSDVLVPVSEKYADEIASHSGFGKALHDIFKIRARKFEYENMDFLKDIARRNNLDATKLKAEKTLVGINNGCDTSNNVLSSKVARDMERSLGLEKYSILPYSSKVNTFEWHNHNKAVYLDKIIKEVDLARTTAGKENPMLLYIPEMTDLTGATVDTPVFALAGRLVDQKGLDMLGKGLVEFYKNFKGNNPPITYIQGVGADPRFINYIIDAKKEVAKFNPQAAKRMVVAGLFSQPGRYDGCKMISDFTWMPSWFEPFGLVHKEIAKFNGAVPIVNKVGGLTANLDDGVNAFFVDFQHRFDPNIDAVTINGKNIAKVFEKAVSVFNDKEKFAMMLDKSLNAEHGWLMKDGPISKYAQHLVDMNVLSQSILQ